MGNSSSESPLRALAHYVVHAQSTERERNHFLNVTFRRRFGVGFTHIDPVDGLLRYLAEEPDVLKALAHLVGRRAWAYLANEIAEDQTYVFWDLDAEFNAAMEKVVQALVEREKQQIRWPKGGEQYLDASWVQTRLDEFERDWAEEQESSGPEKLKPLGTVAWDYLGKLLQHAIRFYSEFFGYGDATDITKAFAHARRQDSLNPLLGAIFSIENKFRPKQMKLPGEQDDWAADEKRSAADQKVNKERDLCMWTFRRNSPFEGLLDVNVQIEVSDTEPEWLKSLKKFHTGLEGKEGQTAKPKATTLHLYQADVDYYRNFYGHASEPDMVRAGIDRAKESFQRAKRIVAKLGELRICPTLIIPVEDGVDAYRRRVVRFVQRRNVKEMGVYPRDKIRYMYPRMDEVIELHEFYFCASPANNGLFEPVIYPARKIISGE